jgi:hypothetical protein
MKQLIATAFAALAIAMTAPLALAQAPASPETAATPATAPLVTESVPGIAYGQGQGTSGPWMMGNYGVGWMGGYAGIGMLSLLVVTVGAVALVVMQKRK